MKVRLIKGESSTNPDVFGWMEHSYWDPKGRFTPNSPYFYNYIDMFLSMVNYA